MRAGAECEPGVEPDDHGILPTRIAPGRADPQALAKLHRSEVVEPLTFPIAIGQRFQPMRGQFLEPERCP